MLTQLVQSARLVSGCLAAERGQGMTEYILVIAIVLAVAGMALVAVMLALAGRFDALAGSL